MSVKIVADGSTDGFALASSASAGGAVALLYEDRPRDLSTIPPVGTEVEIVTQTDDLGREILRHSTAHVLAQAVLRLYPDAKYTIGPPIENGFYYDFDVDKPFTPEDLERIEAEMQDIVKENQRFEREEVGREQALELFAGQPYKLEIIEGVAEGAAGLDNEAGEGPVLSVYRNTKPDNGTTRVAFTDLCHGPHVPGTGRIQAFKLLENLGCVLGAATRPNRCFRGSTAPHGRPKARSTITCIAWKRRSDATIASSAASSSCIRGRRKLVQGWLCGTRRGPSCA